MGKTGVISAVGQMKDKTGPTPRKKEEDNSKKMEGKKGIHPAWQKVRAIRCRLLTGGHISVVFRSTSSLSRDEI